MGMYRYEDYTTTVNSPEEQAVLDGLSGILTVSLSEPNGIWSTY